MCEKVVEKIKVVNLNNQKHFLWSSVFFLPFGHRVMAFFFEMFLIGDSVESKKKIYLIYKRKSYSIDVYSNCNWVQVTHMLTMQKKKEMQIFN